jgi:peptide/nickel transport system permease protein
LRSINSKEFFGAFSVLCLSSYLGFIFAYVLPDNSKINQMHLSIHSKPPGFNVNMLSIPLEEETRKDVE